MVKSLSILFIFFFCNGSSILQCQSLVVLDAEDEQVISGALIRFDDDSVFIQTDYQGLAAIPQNRNIQKVTISRFGYLALEVSMNALIGSGYKVYLKQNTFELDEIVVAANKAGARKSELPVQSLVIRKSQIEFSNPATTADLILGTGEVAVQKSQQGGGSPILRGFEANKVLLVVDGIRMNNAIYRGGHLQNIITLDPSAIEKTEIIYGPSSVIYGSDALGGVLHFYTKSPRLRTPGMHVISGDAMIRYAAVNQEKSTQLGLNLGFKTCALYTIASYSDYGDLRQGKERDPFYGNWGKRLFYTDHINGRDTMIPNGDDAIQKQSGYRQYNFMQKFLWQPGEVNAHLLNFQYSTSSNIPRYDRLTEVNAQGVFRSAEWYYGPQDRLFLSYLLTHSSMTSWYDKFQVNLGYQKIEESRHNRNFQSSSLNHRIEDLDIVSINADFFKATKKHSIQYGIEAYYNKVNSIANRENLVTHSVQSLDTRYPDGGSEMTTGAAFISHQWRPGNSCIVHSGLRYNYTSLSALFNDTTFFPFPFRSIDQKNGSLTGSLGAVLKLNEDFRFNANFSTGFRSPNVDDLAKVFESETGSLVIPNPDLEPEYVYNFELGFTSKFQEQAELSVTGYYTDYLNVITRKQSLFHGEDSILYNGTLSQVFSYQNALKAYLYGVQARLNLHFDNHWSLTSSVNYTYGRIRTDTADYPLDHIPPAFGRTSLQWKSKRVQLECTLMYTAWKQIDDYNLLGEDNQVYASAQGSPAWQTLNLRTSFQLHKSLSLQLALENIFDTYYRVFASGISAPGRNLISTLRFHLL